MKNLKKRRSEISGGSFTHDSGKISRHKKGKPDFRPAFLFIKWVDWEETILWVNSGIWEIVTPIFKKMYELIILGGKMALWIHELKYIVYNHLSRALFK